MAYIANYRKESFNSLTKKLFFFQIQKNSSLLSVPSNNIIKLIEVSKTYHFDIERIITYCPSIASKNPDCVEQICRSLADYEIPFKHLITLPSLLLLTPQYVNDALLTLHTWPEFAVLKSHPKFLSVIKYYKKANLYLEYLKKAGFERCSINLLVMPDKRFNHHLYVGEEGPCCKEIVSYLSEKLDYSVEDVESRLCHHSSFRRISLTRMKSTLAFLFSKGFTKQQIFNGLGLILYSKTKVAKAWYRLPKLEHVQPFSEWRNSPDVLHLLLYVVEKEECVFLKPVDVSNNHQPIP